MMLPSWKILCTILLFLSFSPSVSSQLRPFSPFNYPYPAANFSTLWIKSVNTNIFQNPTHTFPDGSTIRPIFPSFTIAKEYDYFQGLGYACGLYCNVTTGFFLFAIVLFPRDDLDGMTPGMPPEVVWSANRNNPVGENAAVELTNGGDLLLKDADGSLAWSTGTSGKAAAGLNLTGMGNLVLFDANNSVVWQSFDHPTDCLLAGQSLRSGQNLTTANSREGLYSFSVTDTVTDMEFVASVLSNPPQVYFKTSFNILGSYVVLGDKSFEIAVSNATRFMRLGDDGHLRVYEPTYNYSTEIADLLTDAVGECGYPMVCGRYGICTNKQCSCPASSFRQIDDRLPDHGCSEVVPLTCNASDKHGFLDLHNVTYFGLAGGDLFVSYIPDIDKDTCKKACLKNCSCKAAIFESVSESNGFCYLPTEIFSLMNGASLSSVFVKIQISANTTPAVEAVETSSSSLLWPPILGSALGIVFVIGIALFVCRRRRRKNKDAEEDYLDHVPCLSTRFSFEELSAATHNFSNKLGEGGFGSVYEGSLNDGTRIAVKHLDGVGHIKKSFLAEVESIGSIHHINLVTLIGFCADKSRRLLVYEYMCNGSLEKWIYSGGNEMSLDWNTRRKIILDVAKGLAYLHEECRQKILHLDIEPQNILLDEHYNAKLADFGLSKLIDRNQSHVVTTMRGTPGYIAPEWLNGIVTEKLDVYSFGVVVLEIVTGRKLFERSRPEEERHLLTLFKKKAEEAELLDLMDKCCEDEGCDVAEVEKMMKISAWCLHSDHGRRPSMSMVIKVMEGATDVLKEIDCNSLISTTSDAINCKDATQLFPSLLSGPR